MATKPAKKPIDSIVIDTGPLIKNAVSISTIVASAETLYTTPAIISEIRDAATRSRVETTLMPFLNIKTPSPASMEAVAAFAKKTGDFSVLSKQDLGILALAYEVHCEKHSGPKGLRKTPAAPPVKKPAEEKKPEREVPKKVRKPKWSKAEKLARKQAVAEASEKALGEDGLSTETAEETSAKDVPLEMKESHEVATEKVAVAEVSEVAPGAEEVSADAPVEGEDSKEGPSQPKEPNQAFLEKEASDEIAVEETSQQETTPITSEVSPEEDTSIGVSREGKMQQENPPSIPEEKQTQVDAPSGEQPLVDEPISTIQATVHAAQSPVSFVEQESAPQQTALEQEQEPQQSQVAIPAPEAAAAEELGQDPNNLTFSDDIAEGPVDSAAPSSEDDSDGDWITPTNLTAYQASNSPDSIFSPTAPQLAVATMTTDFAMQNVLLRMNLNLLSINMQRIRNIRTSILRCHACFLTTKEMDKQFCPRCGQPSLNRVACSTNAKGEFRIHLAKNYQWNTRGDRFSVPKPVAGTSNGKHVGKGGGQGGWGKALVLAEDQKEYTRQIDEGKRTRTKDLMDEDYLPGILTGDRGKAGGRPKVGAGKNVNSRKRI